MTHLLRNRIGQNTLIKLGSELIGRVASFILLLWAARLLGDADFGRYNYGLAAGFVLAQIADCGLQVLLSREIAVRGRTAQPLLLTALRLKLLLSAVVLLLLLAISLTAEGTLRLALLTLGAAMLLQTYLEFVAYVFRGEQKLALEARLLAGVRLLAALLGWFVLWRGGDLLQLALSQLVAQALALIYAFWLLYSKGWLSHAEDVDWATLARPLLRQALPLGIAIFLSIAYSRLAILLLQTQTDAATVGHFSAAQRLIEPAQILPASMLAAVFPAYAHRLQHARPAARRLAGGVSLLLLAAGALLAAVTWFLAPMIITLLYGEAFLPSVRVLQILGVAPIFAFVNYSLTHYLIARGRQDVIGLFSGMMLLLHLVLSWLLIPLYGAVGPAISTVAAEMLLCILCLGALRLSIRETNYAAPPDAADVDAAGVSSAV